MAGRLLHSLTLVHVLRSGGDNTVTHTFNKESNATSVRFDIDGSGFAEGMPVLAVAPIEGVK